jgi:hypothetical protein
LERIAEDRLMPSMSLVMATPLVTEFLRNLAGAESNRFVVVRAVLHEEGWVFGYTSAAFLESRSFLDLLGGNQPLLVRHDGSIDIIAFGSQVDDIAGQAVCG